MLVAGGSSGPNSNTAELYNPLVGTWSTTGTLVAGRYLHTATLLQNGKVLVAGGIGSDFSTVLASAELYDPATGMWTNTGAMSTARRDHTATLLPNGNVLVVGGLHAGTTDSTLASAELYNPATGSWLATGSMHTTRTAHTATLLPNGKVLVTAGVAAGATSNTAPVLASSELYDPTTGIWSTTGSGMRMARSAHTATLLANGKVLVAGGNSGTGTLASAELYDPSTGAWSVTGGLNTDRSGQTATILSNGRILVTGGFHAPGTILASAELYDPATGAWSVTANMLSARTGYPATILLTGKVLVEGGGVSSAGTAASEVYG